MTTYRLHGLTVASTVGLATDVTAPDARRVDLRVATGAGLAGVDDGRGDLLLDHRVQGRRWYAAVRDDDGVRFEVPGCGRFHLSRDLGSLTCEASAGAGAGLLPVMVAGNVLAFLLALRGWPVLHASAVEVEAGALAIVGLSGMGKSTLAAMLCAAGAGLVTDDVLRVDPDRCLVYRGGSELRLRPRAAGLARHARMRRAPYRTADGRAAATPPTAVREELPLVGVIIPRPRRDVHRVSVSRLDEVQAVTTLLGVPRTLGWIDRAPLATHFAAATTLAARVPMHVVDVPWGPPFDPQAASHLLAALDQSPVSTAAAVSA